MHKSHAYDNQSIDYQIVHKKRKTLGIYIDVYGNIELRVPKNTTDKQVELLIESKWSWIIKKQREQKEKTKGFKKKNYQDEEELLYLGKHYPIRITVDEGLSGASVHLGEDVLEITLPTHDETLIKKLMVKFYKQQCKRLVEGRIKIYQGNFKVKPKNIKITSNKQNWGTCNTLRELTFNWKLAMAPLDVIDYVVIHEMCHMVHMNHDRSFWRLVGKHMPNYEEKQAWLQASHWKMVV